MRRDDATRTNAARAHRSSKHRSRAAPKSRDAPRLERSSDQPKHRDVVFRPDARDLKPGRKVLKKRRATREWGRMESSLTLSSRRQSAEPRAKTPTPRRRRTRSPRGLPGRDTPPPRRRHCRRRRRRRRSMMHLPGGRASASTSGTHSAPARRSRRTARSQEFREASSRTSLETTRGCRRVRTLRRDRSTSVGSVSHRSDRGGSTDESRFDDARCVR